jgi:Rod binding domain-containing protein
MLRSAREAASEQDDSTAETMFDVAGQQFAQMLADRGGLGLAKLITRGLKPVTEAKNRLADPG